MSTQENKRLVRAFFENAINRQRLDLLEEMVSPDMVDHAAPPGLPPGLAGLRLNMQMFFGAFPDIEYSIETMIAEGDLVVTRRIFRGTHAGSLFGIPATGKRVVVPGIDISRVVEGRIVEHWGNEDDLDMLLQLGVAPGLG